MKKPKNSLWITDAILIPETHTYMICLATSRRDLRFFSISSEHFLEEFCIYGFKDVLTCLDYNYDVDASLLENTWCKKNSAPSWKALKKSTLGR